MNLRKPKLKNTVSFTFTITPNKVKYLGVNITKHVEDLYPKNYKITNIYL